VLARLQMNGGRSSIRGGARTEKRSLRVKSSIAGKRKVGGTKTKQSAELAFAVVEKRKGKSGRREASTRQNFQALRKGTVQTTEKERGRGTVLPGLWGGRRRKEKKNLEGKGKGPCQAGGGSPFK